MTYHRCPPQLGDYCQMQNFAQLMSKNFNPKSKSTGLVDQCWLGRPLVITKNIADDMDKMLDKDVIEELSATEIH